MIDLAAPDACHQIGTTPTFPAADHDMPRFESGIIFANFADLIRPAMIVYPHCDRIDCQIAKLDWSGKAHVQCRPAYPEHHFD